MTRQGTITKIEGNRISVSTTPLACCGETQGGNCCGAGKSVEFRALNKKGLSLKAGDFVEVQTPKGTTFQGVVLMLAAPLVLAFAGAWAAAAAGVASGDSRLLIGALGFGLGFGFNLLFVRSTDRSMPEITKVVPVLDFIPLSPQ